jgi:hypothetical protein
MRDSYWPPGGRHGLGAASSNLIAFCTQSDLISGQTDGHGAGSHGDH